MTNQALDMSDLELKYHDITELYDLAEELVETVESEFIDNPEEQLALVEPLINVVGESADILSEVFCDVANKDKSENNGSKTRVEGAFRKLYVAIDSYKKRAKKQSDKIMNIADPIVSKIKRQVEVIVSNFIDFVDVSLARIMQKTQIEDLKRRQEKIAVMLHDIGQETEFQR